MLGMLAMPAPAMLGVPGMLGVVDGEMGGRGWPGGGIESPATAA